MATIRNARDLLMQAAPSRYSNPPNAAIILTASAPVFKIPASGGADPAPITFTANFIELAGTVTFVPVNCTVTVAGNVATLTYANMSGVSASVKATLVENGQTYTSNLCSVTKLADGTSGAGTPGADGARGAGGYYATGSAWSDALADAATPGGNVPGDEVTITNGTTFIQVRQWSGSAWVVTVPIFDGGGIFPGSVTANKINANGLSIRRPDGTLILDAGGTGLQPGFEAPGTKNSLVTISSTGVLSGAGGGQVTALPTVDLLDGTHFGARNRNDHPWEYPVGTTKQFKASSSLGLSTDDGFYLTLETIKQYSDGTGGGVYQYAYATSKTHRRYTANAAGNVNSWSPWVRDLDRNAYTGDLDASKDISLILAGPGITALGNTVTCVGGSWASAAFTLQGYAGGASVSFEPMAGGDWMAGLDTNPAQDSSYLNIDYAFYGSNSNLYFYESGNSGPTLGSYATGDVCSVTFDGTNVTYMKNKDVLRVVPAAVSGPLGFDSSFINGTLRNIRLIPLSNSYNSAGKGGALNSDPACAQPSQWVGSNFFFLTEGVGAGNTFIRSSTTAYISGGLSKPFAMTAGRTYRMSCLVRSPSSVSRVYYLRCLRKNGSGGLINYYTGFEATSYGSATWAEAAYQFVAEAGTVQGELEFDLHWSAPDNGTALDIKNFRVEDVTEAAVAQATANNAQTAAGTALNNLANKLNKNADDILGGVLAVNTVTVPVGLRIGSLTWNASGGRTGGHGLGFTPQGQIAYNSAGTLTFFVNASTGDAYYAGQLAAAYGSFGAVTIAAGGSLSSGSTAYNVGAGFWLQGGATPKFSLRTASGATFLCDPANNVLSMTGGTLADVALEAFSISGVGNVNVSTTNGATRTISTKTASLSGGRAPYKSYTWADVSGNAQFQLEGANTSTLTLKAGGFNEIKTGLIVVTATDANDRTVSTSFSVSATFGTP